MLSKFALKYFLTLFHVCLRCFNDLLFLQEKVVLDTKDTMKNESEPATAQDSMNDSRVEQVSEGIENDSVAAPANASSISTATEVTASILLIYLFLLLLLSPPFFLLPFLYFLSPLLFFDCLFRVVVGVAVL